MLLLSHAKRRYRTSATRESCYMYNKLVDKHIHQLLPRLRTVILMIYLHPQPNILAYLVNIHTNNPYEQPKNRNYGV